MISSLRLIAFSLIIAVSLSVFSIRFNSYTTNNPSAVTVTTNSQGFVVTLNGNSWVYGEPIQVDPISPAVLWATLLRTSGTTGIGLVAAQGCGEPINPATTVSLQGRGNNLCPSDIATFYTPTVPGAIPAVPAVPATDTTPEIPAIPAIPASTTGIPTASSILVVDNPVSFTITQPATTAGNIIGIEVLNQAVPVPRNGDGETVITAAGPAFVDTDNDPTTDPPSNDASEFANAIIQYSLYLETTGSASVCFQDEGQFLRSPGDCGEQLFVYGHSTDSAGILSTSIYVFVALISFILLN